MRCLQQLKHDPELKVRLMATSCCRESVDAAFVRQRTDRRNQPRLSEAAGALEEQHSAGAAARAADDLRRKLPCLISLDQGKTRCVSSDSGSSRRVKAY